VHARKLQATGTPGFGGFRCCVATLTPNHKPQTANTLPCRACQASGDAKASAAGISDSGGDSSSIMTAGATTASGFANSNANANAIGDSAVAEANTGASGTTSNQSMPGGLCGAWEVWAPGVVGGAWGRGALGCGGVAPGVQGVRSRCTRRPCGTSGGKGPGQP
jgi:hypothetical protein